MNNMEQGKEIQDKVQQALSEAINEADGGMVLKWVTVAEILDGEGNRIRGRRSHELPSAARHFLPPYIHPGGFVPGQPSSHMTTTPLPPISDICCLSLSFLLAEPTFRPICRHARCIHPAAACL
jgi:hypothetical protein